MFEFWLKCVKMHNPDPGPFCMSPIFNTPDSDDQLHELSCVRYERRPERLLARTGLENLI